MCNIIHGGRGQGKPVKPQNVRKKNCSAYQGNVREYQSWSGKKNLNEYVI